MLWRIFSRRAQSLVDMEKQWLADQPRRLGYYPDSHPMKNVNPTPREVAKIKHGEGHARQIAESHSAPAGFNPGKHVV